MVQPLAGRVSEDAGRASSRSIAAAPWPLSLRSQEGVMPPGLLHSQLLLLGDRNPAWTPGSCGCILAHTSPSKTPAGTSGHMKGWTPTTQPRAQTTPLSPTALPKEILWCISSICTPGSFPVDF